jgi:hypothetical protein
MRRQYNGQKKSIQKHTIVHKTLQYVFEGNSNIVLTPEINTEYCLLCARVRVFNATFNIITVIP